MFFFILFTSDELFYSIEALVLMCLCSYEYEVWIGWLGNKDGAKTNVRSKSLCSFVLFLSNSFFFLQNMLIA